MKLTAQEQTRFRAYLANSLMRHIEELVPVYIDNTPHLQDDLSDKGYAELEEAFMEDASLVNVALGIDSSIDVFTFDPVANKGDGGEVEIVAIKA